MALLLDQLQKVPCVRENPAFLEGGNRRSVIHPVGNKRGCFCSTIRGNAGAVGFDVGRRNAWVFGCGNDCTFQVHFPETGIIPPRTELRMPLHPKTKLREQPLGWRVLVGESKWGNF